MYVTNNCVNPAGNTVTADCLTPLQIPNRALGVFASIRELRYPKSAEREYWGTHIRIFELPPNEVGKYLVVIQQQSPMPLISEIDDENVPA